MSVVGVVSLCLYGFGMALNDLLDARHDRIFAPRRPIPSGRLQVRTVVVTCLILIMSALLAAAMLSILTRFDRAEVVPWSFIFAIATAFLIVLYDGASKFLGGFGLVTLGAIRALHCLIGNPTTPVIFLSMFLLTHVIIVSTIAYVLEEKRPRLGKIDFTVIVGGVLVGNFLALWRMYAKETLTPDVLPMLMGPFIALAIFAVWATIILKNKNRTPRQKGERLMLLGLFWLFVYDASMLFSNRQPLAGLAVVLLLLCAVASFFGIRHLSKNLGQPKLDYRTTDETQPPPP
jgi:hypothetical protein